MPAAGRQAEQVDRSREQNTQVHEEGKGSGLRTAGYITAGVGVAGLIGAGVTAALGFSARGKLNDKCDNKTCTFTNSDEEDDYNEDLKNLKTLGALTTVFGACGGVLAAAGVTMVIIGGDPGTGGRSTKENVALELVPSAGPAWAGVTAQGAF